jgi:hypothetical protein
MACDCAGQSYSYDSTVRGQPVYPTGLSAAFSVLRSRRARHFWFSLPTHPLFLLNSTFFSAQASFFLVPFAEGQIRCGGFPNLNLPSENRLSAFSHAVVFRREADF